MQEQTSQKPARPVNDMTGIRKEINKMRSIKQILIDRDGMNSKEADDLIEDCKKDLHERLEAGEMPHDICQEWFGLEPDYLMELI